MKKSFQLQKIVFVVYIIAMILCVLYSLGFMSHYSNLFGFEQPLNEDITHFHDDILQPFNNILFFASLFGAASIIVIFALQINKRICDRFACIVSSLVASVTACVSVFAIIALPLIIQSYDKVDFSYMGLEDLNFQTAEYVREYSTFYLGIALYAVIFVAMIFFIAVIIRNYKLGKKNNQVEVGESNV